jgi:pyruvate decarboxylase/indolepyruvate decarboxylase
MHRVTVGEYLLHRLGEVGLRHAFGVPGDYNLSFLDQVEADTRIAWIGCCNELNAAYAADGYARMAGLGAVATTFGVGELSAINGVAGSFAEYVPVVAITGAPSLAVQGSGAMMHHTLGTGDFSVFARMYERVTAAQAFLTRENAAAEIDRVLTICLRRKQPVYISLPADVASASIEAPDAPLPAWDYSSDPEALAEAVDATVAFLNAAERPVVLADVGVTRYRMQDALRRLLDATGYPWATMIMGKGLLEETHPRYIGLYNGAMSDPYVRARIEEADGILTIGTLLSDFNTGGFSAKLDPARTIQVRGATLRIRRALYEKVAMRDVLPLLSQRLRRRDDSRSDVEQAGARLDHGFIAPFVAEAGAPITQRRFWHRLSRFIGADDVVLAEAGTALFGAATMPLPPGATFISQLLWASIGYTLGAMLGTSLAAPLRRSVLLIGDGAMQFTVQELSTALRLGTAPVVFVLNNNGYTVERVIRGPTQAYNDIQPWHHHRIAEVFGGDAIGLRVATEDELEQALSEATQCRNRMTVIDAVMDKMDCPDLLQKIAAAAAAMNRY